jgi:hypothetical protein
MTSEIIIPFFHSTIQGQNEKLTAGHQRLLTTGLSSPLPKS